MDRGRTQAGLVLPRRAMLGQGAGRDHTGQVSGIRRGERILVTQSNRCGSRIQQDDAMNDIDEFRRRMRVEGYCLFPRMVGPGSLARLRTEIPAAQEYCRSWQIRNGVEVGMQGAAHHIVGRGAAIDDFLFALHLDDCIADHFGGPYILNSFGAVDNADHRGGTYGHGMRFHRDVRTFSADLPLMINMLLMVDDFTVENGATRLVPGSHRVAERPSDEELERRSVRAIGSAGSILLFDSNLWHAAAPNITPRPRMALTLTFTRPFFKQQMDYPRMLGEDFPPNDRVRQVLGYDSRVPANHDEWYQPPERRKYKPGQG
ncbi:MAG: phytanoyl-CoA dioxygenase [Burkholderiales bacterium]|nr:MAG: phytanoyl-CoA dioxygenase [Burkholderiales bacterium]